MKLHVRLGRVLSARSCGRRLWRATVQGLGAVALGLPLAAQEPALPARSVEPRTYYAGWLEETVGGDLVAALRIFEAVASDPELGSDERGHALRRMIEIDLARGDQESLARHLALVADDQERARLEEQVPSHAVEHAAELRDAVLRGDGPKAAELRERVEPAMRATMSWTSRWFWPSAEELGSRDATPANGPGDVASRGGAEVLRLKTPLGDPADSIRSGLLRDRAARIAELRLLGRSDEAERLERDLVERLIAVRSRTTDLAPATEPKFAPGEAAPLLATARARLARVLARGRLTTLEVRALKLALEKATERADAGLHEEGVALLASLPYTGLLEPEGS